MESKPFTLANGTVLTLNDKFIVPVDDRPALSQVPKSVQIPVIDLDEKQPSVIKKISDACEEYGVFQVINHGVPKELCQRMITAVHDFFSLPHEERSHLFSDDKSKPLRVTHSYLKRDNDNDDDDDDDDHKVTMWSESLAHSWHPTDDFAHLLPRNPPKYRELASEYAKEIGWLVRRLLYMLSQGLGLKKEYLEKRLGDKPRLMTRANYYPPCPQPELTLGCLTHSDIFAITVLLQPRGVSGLQVIKDGRWVAVDPFPNALVVIVGDQIEVLSNGRYKSVHRRAVTNKDLERASVAMLYGPNKDSIIGPIEELVDEEHPPVYQNYRYQEFVEEFLRQESTRTRVKEVFKPRH